MTPTFPLPESLSDYLFTLPYDPSPEQWAVVEAATQTSDNLLLSALAGAAKTSTLKMLAHALPDVNIITLAFNKSIATELRAELPGNCECMTLNSLGHRVWGQKLGKRLTLEKSKMYGIIKDVMDLGDYSAEEREELSKRFAYLLQAASHAKASGHIPDSIAADLPKGFKGNPLMTDDELSESLDEHTSAAEFSVLIRALEISAKRSFEGIIDFGDQVLFPSVFKCSYPIKSLILVDEVQDLSPLNHAMLAQLYRRRIIAVGDQAQAIYAFRGAFEDGMDALARRFNCRTLPLSVTFRCPEEIVQHVLWRTPSMKASPTTPSGSVNSLSLWSAADLPAECAVLCRNNAPIIALASRLLRAGRYPKVWGDDIARGLLKVMKDLGPRNMSATSARSRLAEWRDRRLKRVKNAARINDQYDCICVFLGDRPTLGAALDYAEQLFNSSGTINLLTCHKSKGWEWSDVFILDENLMSDKGQDPNLRYVACTRTKRTLTYITSEGFDDPQLED